ARPRPREGKARPADAAAERVGEEESRRKGSWVSFSFLDSVEHPNHSLTIPRLPPVVRSSRARPPPALPRPVPPIRIPFPCERDPAARGGLSRCRAARLRDGCQRDGRPTLFL